MANYLSNKYSNINPVSISSMSSNDTRWLYSIDNYIKEIDELWEKLEKGPAADISTFNPRYNPLEEYINSLKEQLMKKTF